MSSRELALTSATEIRKRIVRFKHAGSTADERRELIAECRTLKSLMRGYENYGDYTVADLIDLLREWHANPEDESRLDEALGYAEAARDLAYNMD